MNEPSACQSVHSFLSGVMEASQFRGGGDMEEVARLITACLDSAAVETTKLLRFSDCFRFPVLQFFFFPLLPIFIFWLKLLDTKCFAILK